MPNTEIRAIFILQILLGFINHNDIHPDGASCANGDNRNKPKPIGLVMGNHD